jgi:hypothetical protein
MNSGEGRASTNSPLLRVAGSKNLPLAFFRVLDESPAATSRRAYDRTT